MAKKMFDVGTFNVGDRVVQPDSWDDRYHPNGDNYFGTVVSIEQDGVKVKWDNAWMNKDHSHVPCTNILYLESEWKQSLPSSDVWHNLHL